ncbi:MAG: hypothetical protein ABIT96_00405 [Ferruginibacter sp.]
MENQDTLQAHALMAEDIDSWLVNKKIEIGEEGNNTIDKIREGMRLAERYTEPFREETFVIVPITYSSQLSTHIRQDLNTPFQYLLIVENEDGGIRKGDLVMFYPADAAVTELPDSSFTKFFTTQQVEVEGTFSVISLSDIQQFEMDIVDNRMTTFRLWESRLQPVPNYVPLPGGEGEPYCVDWYLVTTNYYSDGTTEVFYDFLFSQCYNGGGGGGGNGTNPPLQNHEPVQREVSYTIIRKWPNGTLENWEMRAHYQLSGEYYPNNTTMNYFTQAPISVDAGTGTLAYIIIYYAGHYSSVDPWYLLFTLSMNSKGLNNPQSAWANCGGLVSFPNYPNADGTQGRQEFHSLPHTWQASTELY